MLKHVAVLSSLAFLLAGCTAPTASFVPVESAVHQRIGRKVSWMRGGSENAQAKQLVDSLLHRNLTAESAVQIALLNNPDLQSQFEEIGIAQAEWIEAGSLSNPSFVASVRFPDRPPSGTNVEYSVAQNFLNLILIPLRKRIAAEQLAATETRVSAEVLKLASEVKTAFYTAQARQQLVDRLRTISEASEAAAEFTQRLHDAGNVNDLELANQQTSYERSRIEVMQTELQIGHDRERLNRLLGLSGEEINWTMSTHLPDLPDHEISLKGLESRAVSQRLDLCALRMQLDLAGEALALRTKTRYLPASIHLGIDTERQPDRQRVTGPTLDLELPIFNQGQGEIAKLTAQYRQARDKVEALAINVRSEVREAHAQLVAARNLAAYIGSHLLPTQEKALGLTLQQYNYMLKGTYDLLLARQNQLSVERSYIETWRDYWIARSELERAVGGNLNGPPIANGRDH